MNEKVVVPTKEPESEWAGVAAEVSDQSVVIS